MLGLFFHNKIKIVFKDNRIFFFLRYQGLNAGAFYLCATPLALFFVLYFETGSHEVAEGLTKERERERERERGRERARELRLAVNPDPPVSASQSTGITSVQGLTKLQRASLRRERERERERDRERESERAEAGREPGSSGLRLPKYWDYKRAPPRLANFVFYLESGSH